MTSARWLTEPDHGGGGASTGAAGEDRGLPAGGGVGQPEGGKGLHDGVGQQMAATCAQARKCLPTTPWVYVCVLPVSCGVWCVLFVQVRACFNRCIVCALCVVNGWCAACCVA